MSEQLEFLSECEIGAGEVAARLRIVFPQLSTSDRRIADVLLTQPAVVVRSSVSEVAELVGVSAATVVRACRRFGFEGFQDVKISIAQDLVRTGEAEAEGPTGLLDESASSGEVLRRILGAGSQGLADAQMTVDEEHFMAAVETLAPSPQILFLGGGSSSCVAADAAYWFTAIGKLAFAPSDPMSQHLGARHLPAGGVCVAISHSGAFKQTVDAARIAKEAGATVIAVTSFAKSPLTEVSDIALVSGGRSLGYRLEASAGRLVHLTVVDALRIAVALRRGPVSFEALDQMADISKGQQL
ncbi:MurR/RpiR family transcriptional regulator [Paenarthrobacter nicotinovorans]|uniref:MurR/RpiR family transcriptional regulator n=1 Tax=Paenarthrobacter nicotinovorans TaxID=29320 RepID=A0ABV0GY10_PAENI|nr:MurR/RpiR family transcriptional regulator [Paenarthrobacter nicotinovorans]